MSETPTRKTKILSIEKVFLSQKRSNPVASGCYNFVTEPFQVIFLPTLFSPNFIFKFFYTCCKFLQLLTLFDDKKCKYINHNYQF